MNRKFWTAGRLAAAASCLALATVLASLATPAEAQRRQDGISYGPESNPPPLVLRRSTGPNVSYMAGPRTRIYITKRSWLDAGVEVKPGDRHYLDYVLTPGHQSGYYSMSGPAAPAGWQNPNWPLLGQFEAPNYRNGW
jgi:hypothetical protein